MSAARHAVNERAYKNPDISLEEPCRHDAIF
jgi:hypothetical protein